MKDKFGFLEEQLQELKDSGLFNTIKIIESPIDARITINGKEYLNFSSNNYLGLANNKRLRKAATDAIGQYGIGPAAVRTIAGTLKVHAELEEALARFKRTEAVITVQGGFTANLAVIPAITNEEDIIFSDELNHASIIDGCRLSKAKVIRYLHNDPADLERKLRENKTKGQSLIVTDGVFSMDGDIADLPSLAELSEKYGCLLVVDDAHGEGVLGDHGRGVVDHFDLHGKVDIEIGTLSKAFGVVGGYIAGPSALVEWLTQRARPFLFSSALTIPDAGAALEAVTILEESDSLVKKLWENTAYFKEKVSDLGFNTGNSQTPIVPVMLGEAKMAQDFSKALFDEGLFAMAIKYPTVPKGTSRIRVMNSASHSKADLDQAVSIFKKVGKELKVIK